MLQMLVAAQAAPSVQGMQVPPGEHTIPVPHGVPGAKGPLSSQSSTGRPLEPLRHTMIPRRQGPPR
jgi:hypothetical protein